MKAMLLTEPAPIDRAPLRGAAVLVVQSCNR